MRTGRQLVSILIIVCLCFTLVACSSSSGSGGQITLNLGDEPRTLDPQLVADVVPMRVINAVFEGLYRKDQNGLPIPAAAESCDISSDGLTYTFHLRSAKWADNSEVKAEDFKYAWLRALDPKPKEHEPSQNSYLLFYIKGALGYCSGEGSEKDVGVLAKDDKTLVVTLEKPTQYFLDLVCDSVYMPVNKAFYEKQPVKESIIQYGMEDSTVMGNGPFKLEKWKHNESIELIKNESYWNSKEIKLDRVSYKIIQDSSAAFTAFKTGELDMADITLPPQKEESKSIGATVQNYDTGAVTYVAFNNKDSVFANKSIRKALTLSLDRDSLVNKLIKDDSEAATGFVNPVISGNLDSFRKENGALFKDNDLTTAKQYLDAGLKEMGLSKLPKLTLLTDDKETAKRDVVAFQDMWRKSLGLEIEISTMPFDAMLEKLVQGEYQFAYLPWSSDYNDPEGFLDMFTSTNQYNVYQFSNPDYDKLLDGLKTELDKKKRIEGFEEAEKMIIDEMVVCPVYFAKYTYALKVGVKGLVRRNNPIQDIDLYWTSIE